MKQILSNRQIIDRTPAMFTYFRQAAEASKRPAANPRDALVFSHFRLAVFVASQYKGCGLHMEDLIGYANIGLVEAANRYNPSRGIDFAPYACCWCRREITRGLTEAGLPIRLPIRQRTLVKRIFNAQNAFFALHGREADATELAAVLHADTRLVTSLMLSTERFASLDEPLSDDMLCSRADVTPSHDSEDIADKLDLTIRAGNALAQFGPKQREVLRRYYLLEQDIPTIARELRLTPVRIRQILAACTNYKV